MAIPSELASACADIALAGDSDTIQGRQARYVAAPASTEEAAALLREAAALGLTVVPRGAGRLQHWGNPPIAATSSSIRAVWTGSSSTRPPTSR